MASCAWSGNNTLGLPLEPCGKITDGAAVSCCVSGDICMNDGICHYTHSLDGGSSYYTAACTGDFSDPKDGTVCYDRCGEESLPDVVWLSDSTWACCGTTNGTRSCQTPTQDKFSAGEPSSLTAFWTAGVSTATPSPSTVSVSSAASATAHSKTSSPSPSATDAASGSGGLSTGAKAGIGAGVGVAGAALLLVGAFFLWRKRRQSKSATLPHTEPPSSGPASHLPPYAPTAGAPSFLETSTLAPSAMSPSVMSPSTAEMSSVTEHKNAFVSELPPSKPDFMRHELQ